MANNNKTSWFHQLKGRNSPLSLDHDMQAAAAAARAAMKYKSSERLVDEEGHGMCRGKGVCVKLRLSSSNKDCPEMKKKDDSANVVTTCTHCCVYVIVPRSCPVCPRCNRILASNIPSYSTHR